MTEGNPEPVMKLVGSNANCIMKNVRAKGIIANRFNCPVNTDNPMTMPNIPIANKLFTSNTQLPNAFKILEKKDVPLELQHSPKVLAQYVEF